MKKIKATLTALVMAFGVSAGLGTVAATVNPVEKSNVVAQAETVVTINVLAQAGDATASAFYAYPTDGTKPTVNDWDNPFTFVADTGKGFCLNGQQITGWTIKQPGDFYIDFGSPVAAGDMVTLDGKFLCANKDQAVVFNNCNLIYDGTKWGTVTATQSIGSLGLHVNSSVGGASGVNNQLYLWPTSGTPSVQTWDYLFAPQTADSFKINGEPATLAEMKSTGDGIWFNFSNNTISAGDYVTISGTYYCASNGTVYFITESHFLWNGSSWSVYTPAYNIGKVVIASGSSATGVYLNKESGEAFEKTGTWDDKFTFEAGSGVGITINGEMIPIDAAMPGNSIYASFSGYSAKEGDILTIGGTFYSESLSVKYVIEKSVFTWNGSAWVGSDYSKYNLGKMSLNWPSTKAENAKNNQLYLNQESGAALPVQNWDIMFSHESGDGIKVNGEVKTLTEIKSTDLGLFLVFDAVNKGDVVTISGTVVLDSEATRYVIEESKFVWNGTTWDVYVEYTEHNLGKMSLNWPSTGASNAKSNQLYLNQESGAALPIPDADWKTIFTLESGDGLKVNGVVKPISEIKSTDLGLFMAFGAVNAGDVVTISGTFVCPEKTTRYTIEESKFIWNGTTWEKYIEYTTYNVGNVFATKDSSATAVYFAKYGENGNFDVPTGWDEKFTFVAGSGVGVTINGTQINMNDIKVPGTMYVNLQTTAVAGDVLAIGGTFYNETLAIKYVIEESVLEWNGSAWVEYVAEKVYNVGTVTIAGDSTAEAVYFAKANGNNFDVPTGWDEKFTFVAGSGVGVTINDTQINMNDIKVPGTMYVNLGATAAKGDVLTIGGSFYNEANKITYTIAESKFEWNGSAWVKYINYKKHNVGSVFATNDSSATAVYFAKYGEQGNFDDATGWDARFAFDADSGVGVTLNGTQINMNDIKAPGTFFVNLGTTAKVGDMLAIGGTFYNAEYAVKYVIDYTELIWNGTNWVVAYSDSRLAEYDTISITDIGWGLEKKISGTEDTTGLSYIASSENTTGSVKFRFGYNSADTSAGEFNIRLRGSAWQGIQFRVQWGGVCATNSGTVQVIPLSNNTDYVIEIGAIDTADGNSIYTYIMVDGVLMYTEVLSKDANSDTQEGNPAFSTFNTSHVSIYSGDMSATTVTDPDHVAVTYTTDNGSFVEFANKNEEYTLLSGRTNDTFIGWAAGNELYLAGETISNVTEAITFTAVDVDFTLLEGAAIRLANTSDESGIRFTTYVSEADMNALSNYGITIVSYGTLIMPYDYLGADQAPNLDDFVAGETIIQIESTYHEIEEGYLVYRGAMQKMYTANYGRAFAGRGYMEIAFESGKTMVVYTPFDKEDNVRSIRYVAQRFMEDTEEYSVLSAEKKAVVEGYAALGEIELMNYASYAENNVLAVTAWYYPELDSSNAYNNATNIAIAQKMKDAGIKSVYLDGAHHIDLNNDKNIEKTRQIIEFFWSQGLYTIAFGSNAGTNSYIDYSTKEYPDFAECEGFIGFLVWDEPNLANMEKLAEYARNFNVRYAGTDTTFMVNLLPSYASDFNGDTNWWESSVDSLDKTAYKNYLQKYCDTVLSQVQGEKWLSMDSYPVNADESLTANFLFDLAMLKYYSIQAGAQSHAVLQSSGWVEGDSSKNRMPTEAEMRMQAYAAMAFGIDSISWWSYSDKREDNQQNPTDSDEYYTRFANVNNELAKISAVYASFDWKGVILGEGKDNGSIFTSDDDYEAYNLVKGEIGAYELTASDTKHLASVSTNKTNWNYLMGVMQDMNGNEGYVLCNYNSHEEDRTQTITLNFNSNVTEVIIYRGGDAQTVSVTNKTLTIDLATGEGVIVLPSKLG